VKLPEYVERDCNIRRKIKSRCHQLDCAKMKYNLLKSDKITHVLSLFEGQFEYIIRRKCQNKAKTLFFARSVLLDAPKVRVKHA